MTRLVRLDWFRGSMMWMAAGVCVSIAILTWLGYRVTREWQHSSAQFASRRANDSADLLVTALTRDMRGVQTSVLSSPRWDELMQDGPYDIVTLVASAFARYPYPESFFGWRDGGAPPDLLFFNRSDRPAGWMPAGASAMRYPVTVGTHAPTAAVLVARIRRDASAGRRFSIFEVELDGVPYQVVARLLYRDPFREQLDGVFGFTVNLDWIGQHYFPEFTRQVAHIDTSGVQLNLTVTDEHDRIVTSTDPLVRTGQANRRPFPLAFFDPRLVALDRPVDLPSRTWLVQVLVARDPTLSAAIEGADRTLIVSALAAVALAVGFVLTGHAWRASAKLAEIRSEFVSTVTHELKTPIATIRAAGDTLAAGRIADAETSREYAQIVVQEARRLTRLVDNLLAYARVTDVADVYSFEPTSVHHIVQSALDRCRRQLVSAGCRVEVNVSPGLPPVRVDRTAMELLIDNLIDNAIRYSHEPRRLRISARAGKDGVRLELADNGQGIPPDEIERVTRKFVRGRDAGSGGSGLGLAIAARIARDHGGSLAITSEVRRGTTVVVALPAMGALV